MELVTLITAQLKQPIGSPNPRLSNISFVTFITVHLTTMYCWPCLLYIITLPAGLMYERLVARTVRLTEQPLLG